MQECCKWDWIEIGKKSIEIFFNFLLEGFWDHLDSVAIVEQGSERPHKPAYKVSGSEAETGRPKRLSVHRFSPSVHK